MRIQDRGLVAVVLLVACVTLAGCGGDAAESTSTSAPTATRASGSSVPSTTALTTTTAAKASRSAPLAERVFRVNPKPTMRPEQAAVRVLQGYLDGMVTAFATNDLEGSGVRRFTTPATYADARRLVAEQVAKGYVLYGPYTFTIQPQGARSRVAVATVCVDQSQTRRHDAKTDAARQRNDTPYVRLTYTLNRRESGWMVVAISGRDVVSCPG
jgi:hypothetical protein